MKNSLAAVLIVFVLGWTGCAPSRVAQPPSVPTVPPTMTPPAFERTFGDVVAGSGRELSIRYKSIAMVIDPADAGNPVDYVFLTTSDPGSLFSLRKDTKIIAPTGAQIALKQNGFSDVKTPTAGSRLMLKKEGAFLFVNTVPSAAGTGYLLEFDNGRNLFVAPEAVAADALREFVYGLRDDGKEVYAAFFRAGSGSTVELAQAISLVQPLNALIQNPGPAFSNDQSAFFEALKADLFDGPTLVIKPGQTVPF